MAALARRRPVTECMNSILAAVGALRDRWQKLRKALQLYKGVSNEGMEAARQALKTDRRVVFMFALAPSRAQAISLR